MQINEAFDLAVKLLDIKPSELARRSGVSAAQISRYRDGDRDISANSLVSLLREMPDKARKALLECVDGSISKEEFINKLIKK